MKQVLSILAVLFILNIADAQENQLWYLQPATKWTEALPVGNGRMAAMVFGDPFHERIQLNEESLWAGTRVNDINPAARSNLKNIQQLLLDEKNQEAYTLTKKFLLGIPPQIRSYQTLGDLFIDLDSAEFRDYKRVLDISRALHTVTYSSNQQRITEEIFISAPDDILVIRIRSSVKGALNMKLRLDRKEDAEVKAEGQNLVMPVSYTHLTLPTKRIV